MTSLKPCPFCGGEPTLYQDEMTGHWAVRCVKDTARPTLLNSHGATAWCYSCTDPAEAIKAWNTRADDQSQAAAYWRRMYEETVSEEIVRCRDCKYMHTVRNWLGMDVDECWLHADRESGARGKERTEPNGFCAWGERKEEDK